MKVVCIMQARVGSTRLPGKVLKKICGRTVLEHDINRLKLVNNIDEIVIATTTEERDSLIVDEAVRLGVKYFRGSEDDVLARYYLAAKEHNADIVMRVTSDCPCLDQKILEDMINVFLDDKSGIDYMSNTLDRTYPRGYDAEIFTFKSLEEAYLKAEKDFEREHVTPYLYDKNNKYKMYSYKGNCNYSQYRITLDTREDFEVINLIYKNLFDGKNYFLLKDVVSLLEKRPEIAKINEDIEQKKLGE